VDGRTGSASDTDRHAKRSEVPPPHDDGRGGIGSSGGCEKRLPHGQLHCVAGLSVRVGHGLDGSAQHRFGNPLHDLQNRAPCDHGERNLQDHSREIDVSARHLAEPPVESGDGPSSRTSDDWQTLGAIQFESEERIMKILEIETFPVNDEDARCQRIDLDPDDFGILAELPAQAREVSPIVPLRRDLEPQASGAAVSHIGVLSWMHL
jgi:hypothetical protein